MGKMKEILEKEWTEEEKRKWLNDTLKWQGIVYDDLIDMDMIADEKLSGIKIVMADTWVYARKHEIIEINGISIKIQEDGEYTTKIYLIPFEKILRVEYLFEK